MEVDYSPDHNLLSPQDRILRRLLVFGVPREKLDHLQSGLVDFLKDNKSRLPELVSAILPADEDVLEAYQLNTVESGGNMRVPSIEDQICDSLVWLQWLMFEGEPQSSQENLAQRGSGQFGVCGAVWGRRDLAYKCLTCEQDPTCAICVPCFKNGNHEGHDYYIIHTMGGCCDCGDMTAFKSERFCSQHKGLGQIQPLPDEILNSVGLVLDALLVFWNDKLLLAEASVQGNPRDGDHTDLPEWIGNKLSSAVVDMLLDFCKYSENLLILVSKRISSLAGLLGVLVRAERFLHKPVVKMLHDLLLKLLGDPLFKYEFAKVYVNYYPCVVNEAIEECSDYKLEKYSLLHIFSVQIFTVPTVILRLIKEVDLLGELLGCLANILLSCVGEDGLLKVSRWANLWQITIRLIGDIGYVMRHVEVPKYVALERLDVSVTWLRILCILQGMDPQKRVTCLHVEKKNDNSGLAFLLGRSTEKIHNLLVAGACSVGVAEKMKDNNLFGLGIQDLDVYGRLQHAKMEWPHEASVCSVTDSSSAMDCSLQETKAQFYTGNFFSLPSSVTWLCFECLRSIELNLSPDRSRNMGNNAERLRKAVLNTRNARNMSRLYQPPLFEAGTTGVRLTTTSSIHQGMFDSSSAAYGRCHTVTDLGSERSATPVQNNSSMVCDMGPKHTSATGVIDDHPAEEDCVMGVEALGVKSLIGWQEISYDVSSQDISLHIPLHRLLSLLIQKALKKCYGESGTLDMPSTSTMESIFGCYNFFEQLLGGCHPYGFSSIVMEHPLRLRVFCAQVRAGMWRKNGDTALLSCESYYSSRRFEQGLDLDLFLLQCCAALAPPDLYVKRIQERFGLSNYFSLNLASYSEYEPVLVQEMLLLIIQIVKERRFCGFSETENLQRELVYKLAIEDATRSQLVNSIPYDLSKSDQLQKILDTVAVYVNPSHMKQGKYSLQKAYWKELDLYHPCWNARDLQAAEERYFQFSKNSALTSQLPRWTNVLYPLNTISRIATSKSVLQIVRAVFFYAVYESRTPDRVVYTALHLLSLALDICYLQRQASIAEFGCNVDELPPTRDRLDTETSTSCQLKDPFPILAYATEEIDVEAVNGPLLGRHRSMVSLLVLLMKKYKKENEPNFMEPSRYDIASLTGSLVKKLAELNAACLTELQRLAPDVTFHSSQQTLRQISVSTDAAEQKEKIRERQAAIMEEFRAAQSRFTANLKSARNGELDSSDSKQEVSLSDVGHVSEELAPVCSLCQDPDSKSPISFLILLQKSRLTSFIERGPPSWNDICNLERKHPFIIINEMIDPSRSNTLSSSSETISSSHSVQLIQNAVNELTNDNQQEEIDPFLESVKMQFPTTRNIWWPSASHDTSLKVVSSLEMMEDDIYQSVQREIHESILHSDVLENEQKYSISHVKRFMKNKNVGSSVLGEYVTYLSREASNHPPPFEDRLSRRNNVSSISTPQIALFDGFSPGDCDGIYVSSCGHAVHRECRDRYLSSLRQRRLAFGGGHIVDPDQGEFLCPVCRALTNSVLPAFLGDSKYKVGNETLLSDLSSASITFSSTTSNSVNDVPRLAQASSLLWSVANAVGDSRILKSFSLQLNDKSITPALKPVFHLLCRMYFPDRDDNFSASGRVSHSMILWDTLRYSLISTEIAARGRKSNVCIGSPNSGLEALYKEVDSSNGFILSLLLQVVQTTRVQNRHQVLLRFRGIQLFAGSICSGVSVDEFSTGTCSQRGNISSILKHVGEGVIFPDIQFWKQAADPVLAHDPFSSLMWVLFCLPLPFLSSTESFLSLVHLFYVVCVVQAIIACRGIISQSRFCDRLINDIYKIMGESVDAQQYFTSNYTESSCHPRDMIRRFTFPYLRRCALLWNLLKSSPSEPFFAGSRGWGKSYPHGKNDTLESTSDFPVDLKEGSKLEHMFQLFSLEVVLRDKMVHSLALKWCKHFSKEFGVRNYGRILHFTPAVPFKLMCLPQVYHDLLQRYVKQQCPDCKSVPEEPALCLLCGRLCSPSWNSCCRDSECQSHSMVCGAGIGVYLLIRKTTILLQRSARQAPWPSPYLDAFGEEDVEVRRGRPLYLNDERYSALTHMVASHALDRSSEVLRQPTIDLLFTD